MNQLNQSEVNLNPIFILALKNKLFIFFIGFLLATAGYIYTSLGNKIYNSSINIVQSHDFNIRLMKSSQKTLSELGFNPEAMAQTVAVEAFNFSLLNKTKSLLNIPADFDISIEYEAIYEDANATESEKRWIVVSSGLFNNKKESKIFLSKLINLAYQNTYDKYINILVREIKSYETNAMIMSQNHAEHEINIIINKNIKRISLLENEMQKAEILNYNEPQYEFIKITKNQNYIFNNNLKDDKNFVQGDIDELDMLNYFYGTSLLKKEIEFLKNINVELLNPEANRSLLYNKYSKNNFLKKLSNEMLKIDYVKSALKDFRNNYDPSYTGDDVSSKFAETRTDLIDTYMINRLPAKYVVPVFFILGMIIGFIIVFFRQEVEKINNASL